MGGDVFAFEFNLPFFKGPIELLLHLLQKKSLNITEISLALVTEDFLSYIKKFQHVDSIKIAEFLEVASHFVYMKSLSLLPFYTDENLDETEVDYRKNLVERLIEYNKLKKGLDFLKEKKDSLLITRGENLFLRELKNEYHIENIALTKLFEKTSRFFREAPKIPLSEGIILLETLSVEERMSWLSRFLNRFLKISFFKMVKRLSFTDQVMSFLASLELGKQKQILLSQIEVFEDITLEKVK